MKRIFLILGLLCVGLAVALIFKNSSEQIHRPSTQLRVGARKASLQPTRVSGIFRIERAHFRTVTEKAFKELPTFSEIKSGPLHPHPAALTQGAETFGAIFDSIRKNPELIPDAIQFYHACTSREDVLTAIRANCLRYLIDSSERIGKDVSLDIYPPRIRQIVRWIPRKRW